MTAAGSLVDDPLAANNAVNKAEGINCVVYHEVKHKSW